MTITYTREKIKMITKIKRSDLNEYFDNVFIDEEKPFALITAKDAEVSPTLKLVSKNGQISNFAHIVDRDTIDEMLTDDDNTAYFGELCEVALVDAPNKLIEEEVTIVFIEGFEIEGAGVKHTFSTNGAHFLIIEED